MKKGLTELVIIIDKSGSMNGLEKDVVGGYNSLIAEQKKEEGSVLVTTIFFDTKYKEIVSREDINILKELMPSDYRPSGCTALLDTVGNAITSLKEKYAHIKEDELPEHVIFSIMTDGLENSSREYTYKQIKTLIESQKKEGWEFIFQAANIDAFNEGDKLGISVEDIAEFAANSKGVKCCFEVGCAAIKAKRTKKKAK